MDSSLAVVDFSLTAQWRHDIQYMYNMSTTAREKHSETITKPTILAAKDSPGIVGRCDAPRELKSMIEQQNLRVLDSRHASALQEIFFRPATLTPPTFARCFYGEDKSSSYWMETVAKARSLQQRLPEFRPHGTCLWTAVAEALHAKQNQPVLWYNLVINAIEVCPGSWCKVLLSDGLCCTWTWVRTALLQSHDVEWSGINGKPHRLDSLLGLVVCVYVTCPWFAAQHRTSRGGEIFKMYEGFEITQMKSAAWVMDCSSVMLEEYNRACSPKCDKTTADFLAAIRAPVQEVPIDMLKTPTQKTSSRTSMRMANANFSSQWFLSTFAWQDLTQNSCTWLSIAESFTGVVRLCSKPYAIALTRDDSGQILQKGCVLEVTDGTFNRNVVLDMDTVTACLACVEKDLDLVHEKLKRTIESKEITWEQWQLLFDAESCGRLPLLFITSCRLPSQMQECLKGQVLSLANAAWVKQLSMPAQHTFFCVEQHTMADGIATKQPARFDEFASRAQWKSIFGDVSDVVACAPYVFLKICHNTMKTYLNDPAQQTSVGTLDTTQNTQDTTEDVDATAQKRPLCLHHLPGEMLKHISKFLMYDEWRLFTWVNKTCAYVCIDVVFAHNQMNLTWPQYQSKATARLLFTICEGVLPPYRSTIKRPPFHLLQKAHKRMFNLEVERSVSAAHEIVERVYPADEYSSDARLYEALKVVGLEPDLQPKIINWALQVAQDLNDAETPSDSKRNLVSSQIIRPRSLLSEYPGNAADDEQAAVQAPTTAIPAPNNDALISAVQGELASAEPLNNITMLDISNQYLQGVPYEPQRDQARDDLLATAELLKWQYNDLKMSGEQGKVVLLYCSLWTVWCLIDDADSLILQHFDYSNSNQSHAYYLLSAQHRLLRAMRPLTVLSHRVFAEMTADRVFRNLENALDWVVEDDNNMSYWEDLWQVRGDGEDNIDCVNCFHLKPWKHVKAQNKEEVLQYCKNIYDLFGNSWTSSAVLQGSFVEAPFVKGPSCDTIYDSWTFTARIHDVARGQAFYVLPIGSKLGDVRQTIRSGEWPHVMTSCFFTGIEPLDSMPENCVLVVDDGDMMMQINCKAYHQLLPIVKHLESQEDLYGNTKTRTDSDNGSIFNATKLIGSIVRFQVKIPDGYLFDGDTAPDHLAMLMKRSLRSNSSVDPSSIGQILQGAMLGIALDVCSIELVHGGKVNEDPFRIPTDVVVRSLDMGENSVQCNDTTGWLIDNSHDLNALPCSTVCFRPGPKDRQAFGCGHSKWPRLNTGIIT